MRQPHEDNDMTARAPLSQDQVAELLKAIDAIRVTFDQPDGLARLKHEDIRRRLIQIFGPTGWGLEIISSECIHQGQDPKSRNLTIIVYEAHVRLHIHPPNGKSTFFDGTGVWDGTQRQLKRGTVESVTQARHNIKAAAESAALCRAVINLGDQFGLSLYSDDPRRPYVRYSIPYTGPEEHTVSVPVQASPPDAEVPGDTKPDDGSDTPDAYEQHYDEDPDHPGEAEPDYPEQH